VAMLIFNGIKGERLSLSFTLLRRERDMER
jgi:hypothetical protein